MVNYRVVYDDDNIGDGNSSDSKTHAEEESVVVTQTQHHPSDHNNYQRGRHLVATTDLALGQVIFVERPMLALQSIENVLYHQICHGCKAFVGGPGASIQRRCDMSTMQKKKNEAAEDSIIADSNSSSKESVGDEDAITTTKYCREISDDDPYESTNNTVIQCRQNCGHVYCSVACEEKTWNRHHVYLCTGDCTSNDDPLVQLKHYAVMTNEILLLVLEWWIAQHTTSAAARDAATTTTTTRDPYTDFVMNPWWDVVTSDLLQQPGGFTEASILQQQLQEVCATTATLFNTAMQSKVQRCTELEQKVGTAAEDNGPSSSLVTVVQTTTTTVIPDITAWDIAIRIGACEQNAMGIRQRSPLCRDIMDASFRQKHHNEIIQCLADAGFIGNEDNNNENGDDEDDDTNNDTVKERNVAAIEEEVWDYSVDEIAAFLATLYMNEEFSMRTLLDVATDDNDGDNDEDEEETKRSRQSREGDDLDILFPPLDGTAMYAVACKMNHSCDPNVIVLYPKRVGWGSSFPLSAVCVALRNIAQGEELTISYIDASSLSYSRRQAALANYGFQCTCSKCVSDQQQCLEQLDSTSTVPTSAATATEYCCEDDDDDDEGRVVDNDSVADDQKVPSNSSDEAEEDGETQLQKCLDHLDTAANLSLIGSMPLVCYVCVRTHVESTVAQLLHENSSSCTTTTTLNNNNNDDDMTTTTTAMCHLLQQCVTAIQQRDYCLCQIVGNDLAGTLRSYTNAIDTVGGFSSVMEPPKMMPTTNAVSTGCWFQQAYWCAVLTSCIGCVHDYHFVVAQNMMDEALQRYPEILSSENSCRPFLDYVHEHAFSCRYSSSRAKR